MLPDSVVVPVQGIDIPYFPETHPYEAENRSEARLEWQEAVRRQPFLFDGEVGLARDCALSDGRLRAPSHLVSYSTFLHWRARRPVPGTTHIFAMPFLVSADERVIAIRMGARTANPGRVYCPSGSFDRSDLVDGLFDPETNMQREVLEETGIDLCCAKTEGGYHVMAQSGILVVLRIRRLAIDAAEAVARIADHVRRDPDPEIDGAVAIARNSNARENYAPHMPPILDWYFAGKPGN